MAYSLHKHLLFNEWANAKFAETLRKVDDAVYFAAAKSSFASIAKTVIHIWGAQHVWLRRMEGESLVAFPVRNENNKDEALDGLVQSSTDIVRFAASKDAEFLSTVYAYKSLKGDPFEDPYEDTLFHVVNHGAYHRGQIVTLLREAGIATLPATDLIHYLRTLKR